MAVEERPGCKNVRWVRWWKLTTLGADIRYTGKDGYPPLEIRRRKVGQRIDYGDGSVSSQFISALLLVAFRHRVCEFERTGNWYRRLY